MRFAPPQEYRRADIGDFTPDRGTACTLEMQSALVADVARS
jgi:hypothetical protein